MSTDIIKHDSGLDMMSLGRVFQQSGYFQDAKSEAQAIVKILAGQEMGISPVAAMMGINIIQGRVSLSANLMAAKIKGSGKYDYRVRKLDDNECTIEFFQGTQSIGASTFTQADAKRANTKNMNAFPRNMLFARALSNGAKWYCPDAFNGTAVYTPDELSGQPIDGTGEILDGIMEVGAMPTEQPKDDGKQKHIMAVRAFIEAATAIGVELADIPPKMSALSLDELSAIGKQIRSAMEQHINALADEAGHFRPTMTGMKPSELRALGEKYIKAIAEKQTAEMNGARFEPTEADLVEASV